MKQIDSSDTKVKCFSTAEMPKLWCSILKNIVFQSKKNKAVSMWKVMHLNTREQKKILIS